MGSEFAFEDLSDFELEKYAYRYIGKDTCGEFQCFVTEWVPAYEHSGYARMEIWHDQAEYRVQRINYYDRRNAHLKFGVGLNERDFDQNALKRAK